MAVPTPTNVFHLKLSVASAREILREAAKNSARVFFSPHARKQMVKRKITDVQVLRCLANGQIKEGPARGIKGNWEVAWNHCRPAMCCVWRQRWTRTKTATT